MSLTGKRIIVTGSASGIGQQSAKILQEQGATIAGFDRNEPPMTKGPVAPLICSQLKNCR